MYMVYKLLSINNYFGIINFIYAHAHVQSVPPLPWWFLKCEALKFRSCAIMVYTIYKKERILYLYSQGLKPPTITKILVEENMTASREGIHKFLQKFSESGCLLRHPGCGHPSKVTADIKAIVEQQMRLDNETTAYQLHGILTAMGYKLSLRTTCILRCRMSLGWTFRGSAYCQLTKKKKEKRLHWALQYKDNDFEDVIYTDECNVNLESHRRFCC